MPKMIYKAAPRTSAIGYHEVWCVIQWMGLGLGLGCNCHDWENKGICPTQEQLYFQSAVETWMWAWRCLYHAGRCEYRSHGGAQCEQVNGHMYNHSGHASEHVFWQEQLLEKRA